MSRLLSLIVCAAFASACLPSDSSLQEPKAPSRMDVTLDPLTGSPCPVTRPNGSTPPGERPGQGHFGNGAVWTALWPDGKVIFSAGGAGTIGPDGSLSMKFPWWFTATGTLSVTGRRLDGPAPPLTAWIPGGYDGGFQATGLTFPTEGCWEVTGSVGAASLTFVTLVRRR